MLCTSVSSVTTRLGHTAASSSSFDTSCAGAFDQIASAPRTFSGAAQLHVPGAAGSRAPGRARSHRMSDAALFRRRQDRSCRDHRINFTMRPTAPQARITGITPARIQKSASAAAAAMASEGQSGAWSDAFGPEHVEGEVGREIRDHAHHGGGDRGQRRGEQAPATRGLDQRCAGENEHERWQEREERDHQRAREAGQRRETTLARPGSSSPRNRRRSPP